MKSPPDGRMILMKPTLLFSLLAFTIPASALDLAEFERLHQEIQPAEDAVWRSIPWETSVLDAQAKAAREGKPIFIWAMDGHPLGCT